ncbi:MAG: 16S rRNA (cytidine(1402)-2'-O)-methyltransferase [Alphaproteobacteria bacterium]|nr:16S rRNA (cytidine(1402)-2'-O)-methyltransferase [Alphaproteobacteria bacterium]
MTRATPPTDAPSPHSGKQADYTIAGATHAAPPLEPGLYVVATPIGNLGDITLRALATLAAADLVFCEDTRISRRLLERYGITARLSTYHDHNGDKVRPQILDKLENGASVALISDAGTPIVSDPGYKLVKAARERGIEVYPLPGPSAPIAGLAKSGLPSDRFFFGGFLPVKQGARRKILSELSGLRATLIFFDTGNRIAASLADVAETLGARHVVVTRELTKLHEQALSGEAGPLAQTIGKQRGEITLLIAPPEGGVEMSDERIEEALRSALAELPVGKAASRVAKELGVSRQDLYDRALDLKNQLG